jgi:hypothetical protein
MADKPAPKAGAECLAMDGSVKGPPTPSYQPPQPQSFRTAATATPKAAAGPPAKK